MRKSAFVLPAIVVILVIVMSSVFVVDEREKVLVLQFGQIKSIKEEPGLSFKIPLIQDIVRYDDRILSLDTEAIEVTPSDDRRLVVDAFARYRIADVRQFRQAVGTGGLRTAEDRLEGILNPQIRAVLGSDGVTSNTILSSDRAGLMARITAQARQRALPLGLEVIDVRLKQTNLPTQNLDATFARMRAEREREAADEIARGEEAAQRVRAQADRTVVELVSVSRREAEITRGEADAERNRVFADAFGQDAEFFEFYRSLTAYTRALKGSNSTLVISPDGEFFNYLDSARGRDADTAAGLAGGTDNASPADRTAESAAPVAPTPDANATETTGTATPPATEPTTTEPTTTETTTGSTTGNDASPATGTTTGTDDPATTGTTPGTGTATQ